MSSADPNNEVWYGMVCYGTSKPIDVHTPTLTNLFFVPGRVKPVCAIAKVSGRGILVVYLALPLKKYRLLFRPPNRRVRFPRKMADEKSQQYSSSSLL